ncbi:hypothetical protein GCM10009779_02310 [Polymorphospora rubra]|uniref:Uncharacterized protein n=2 Tax=Polymorphospora rubra TaxID=338584 RepID=A0A810MX27_9ACTN|nr:hypothetical protein Prubr_27470 [Polymorphospora rubra]
MPGWAAIIAGIVLTAIVGATATAIVGKVQSAVADDYRVTVESNPDRITSRTGPIGGSYVVAKPIQDIGEPPIKENSCVGRYDWAYAMGGVDADSTAARVIIEGLTETVVHIDGISATVLETAAPSLGSNLTCRGRGEQPNVRYVTIDLDTNPPTVLTYDASGMAVPFVFTVSKGQSEVLDISATTNKCTCSWQVTLRLSIEGKAENYTVQARGKRPFKTTSSANAKWYQWVGGTWVEQRTGPDEAEPTPDPNELPGPIADVCLLASPHVAAVLNKPHRTQRDAEAIRPGPGGNLLRHSGCTFVADTPAPTASPTGETLIDSVNVWLDGAKTDPVAKTEFDVFAKNYSLNGPSQALPGVAQDAVLFDGVFLVRTGRLLLTVQISTDSRELQERTRALGEAVFKELQ